MNVELLRKIAAVIQEKPAEFDISDYHTEHECGTAHCIGGWAEVLSGRPQTMVFTQPRDLLELTNKEAFRLFHAQLWPEQFDYEDPASAASRIEHFIATEGRE